MNSTPKLILALDVDTFAKAKYFVDLLYPKVKIFKVGVQLFAASGREIIRYIKAKGADVFLDLKFFDIPNTVANAAREVVRMKAVSMFTLHAQGGPEMMRKTRQAVKEEAAKSGVKPPLLIGVTVLTSEKNRGNILPSVLKLTKLAKEAGLQGVVCSVKEAKSIRKKFGKNFIIVTPGIRLAQDKKADQKRTATAKEAYESGSNYLVIGRPILEAKNPVEATKKILLGAGEGNHGKRN